MTVAAGSIGDDGQDDQQKRAAADADRRPGARRQPTRRGRPPIPPPPARDRAISVTVRQARNSLGLTVREVLARMDLPLSAPAYAKFESGQRAIPTDVLAEVCRVLGLQLDDVVAEASAGTLDEQDGVPPLILDGSGPAVPAIRVSVARLMSTDNTWLDPIRGMLALLTAGSIDGNGEILVEEPLTRTIAASTGRSLIECWMALTAFIDPDEPVGG